MTTVYQAPCGGLKIEVSGGAVSLCRWIGDTSVAAAESGGCRADMADYEVMEAVCHQLDEYFSGQREGFDLPIDVRGTAFREKVWRALQEIPYGATYSYGQLAEAVGCRGGQRAVAQACSANRLAILVPCHRVVAANGSMGGYTISHSGSRRGSRPAGLAVKEYLLNLERRRCNNTPIGNKPSR